MKDKAEGRGLRDKVIVVTGATSGFGKGAALRFAKAGAALVLAGRRDELLSEIETAALGASGHRGLGVHTDVGNEAEVAALAAKAIEQFGRIDIWVINAGVGAVGKFWDIPLADHRKVIETTLLGTVYGSWHAMKHFVAQGQGTLINIASIVGRVPQPYFESYVAAKHGVIGLSSSLRLALREQKLDKTIHVCTVLPGAHDTPWFDHAANFTGHDIHPAKAGDPEAVIEAIVRLAEYPDEEEVAVGADAERGLRKQGRNARFERKEAHALHKEFMVDAPPGEDTHGALFDPNDKGAGVHGGNTTKHR